jgi:hypothetical protein
MECDTTETEATKRMKLKEKQTLMKVLERCKAGSYCIIYGDEIETVRRAIETRGRAIKKKEDLERVIDIDTEPQYWEKERYTLDTLNQVLGQEKTRDKEVGEER